MRDHSDAVGGAPPVARYKTAILTVTPYFTWSRICERALSALQDELRLDAVLSRRPGKARPLAAVYDGPAPVFTADLDVILANPEIRFATTSFAEFLGISSKEDDLSPASLLHSRSNVEVGRGESRPCPAVLGDSTTCNRQRRRKKISRLFEQL